jgi:hypothetical protein
VRTSAPARARRALSPSFLAASAAGAVLLAACGGGDSPAAPAPTLALSAPSAAVAVQQGQNGTAALSLARGGGFGGPVTLTAAVPSGATGVTATFAPSTVPGDATQSTLTVATTAATPAGEYTVNVTGAGTGVSNAQATVRLRVSEAPGLGLGVTNAAPSVARGGSVATDITLARRGNYAGDVTLTAEGLPAGVTATFAPAALSGATVKSTLTLTAAADAPDAAATNVVVRAAGPGGVEATFTLPVTVTATRTVAVAPAATALTVGRGANAPVASTALTITRPAGFTGPVTLAATAPAGVTATVAPSSLAEGVTSATLTVVADGSAALGAGGAVVVTATGAGITDGTLTLPLTVVAPAVGLAQPANAAAAQGGAAQVPVTLAPSNLTGAVTVTLVDPPAGITAQPLTIAQGQTAGTMTVNVAAGAAAGARTLTLRAAGAGGAPVEERTFTLTVNAAAPAPSIAVTAPGALAVTRGATATGAITLARAGNYAGDVTLSAEGLPAGVTATFAPATLSGATLASTVSFAAGAGAATGTQNVTLRARGQGVADATQVVALTVNPGNAGGTSVRYTFCESDAPVWVAVQNGDGAWARVAEVAPRTYDFAIGQRGALAYVTRSGAGAAASYRMRVDYSSLDELRTSGQAAACTLPDQGGKTLTGSVAGMAAAGAEQVQMANVVLGGSSAMVMPGLPGFPNFSLDKVADGPLTLVATRSAIGGGGAGAVDRVILRRNVNAAAGSALPVLDFDGAEAFAPAAADLTLGNLGNDQGYVAVSFYAGQLGGANFSTALGTNPLRYAGVPAAHMGAGDLHLVTALARPGTPGDAEPASGRYVFQYVRDVVDRTVNLGPALSAPAVAFAPNPQYLRPRAQLAAQAEYGALATVTFRQDAAAGAGARSLTISRTAGHAGGTAPGTWELATPDFTGVDGFDPAWALRTNGATTWTAGAYGGSVGTLLGAAPTEGSSFRGATRDGATGNPGVRAARLSAARLAGAAPAAVAAQRLARVSPYRR